MPSGLLVFNTNATFEVTPDTRLVRLIGSFYTVTVSGSLVVNEWTQGQPFFIPHFTQSANESYSPPKFYVYGNTFVWNFPPTANPINCRVVLGVTA